MQTSLKGLFQYYLDRLGCILDKVPEDEFSKSLAPGMLSLEENAKVALTFVLRGYCPLLGEAVVSFYDAEPGRNSLQQQLAKTLGFLEQQPDVSVIDKNVIVEDKAGFNKVALLQPDYIQRYILPNFMFHLSMVYGIARANGVELGKGDFDGMHSYPAGFSF